jgi:hypothetical protein
VKYLFAVCLFFVLAACTDSTTPTPTPGTDTTPPTIVSINPPNGAKGVNDEASIVITFSEKMNQAATQAAYQSADLSSSDVIFSWNAEGTVLTIKPNDFLEYAAGDDPSIEAKTYTLGVTSMAKDAAGNSLTPFSSSFSTLKVIVTSIYATANLDGEVIGVTNATAVSNSTVIRVGTTSDSIVRGFFSFDLTGLPAGVVTDEAKLIINKEGMEGNPYEFSNMSLDHVIYGSNLSGDDYDTPVLADLGIFDSASAPATGYLSSNVTSALNDDLTNRASRGNRSQYRLSFRETDTQKGPPDYVSFKASEGPEGQRPFLNVVYYLP